VGYLSSLPKGVSAKSTQGDWSTADGSLNYLNGGGSGWGPGRLLYGKLGSLPSDPVALDHYLAHLADPNDPHPSQASTDATDFLVIRQLLSSGVLPPSVNAELYQALGALPTVQVKSHVTDIDGRAGVAFVLPESPSHVNLEIILVSGPGSVQADSAPPAPPSERRWPC
jgi:hypothetical protein